MGRVLIAARREAYGIEDIHGTMTVSELIEYLQDYYDEDDKIYFSHDNGYTYGGITSGHFIDEE